MREMKEEEREAREGKAHAEGWLACFETDIWRERGTVCVEPFLYLIVSIKYGSTPTKLEKKTNDVTF